MMIRKVSGGIRASSATPSSSNKGSAKVKQEQLDTLDKLSPDEVSMVENQVKELKEDLEKGVDIKGKLEELARSNPKIALAISAGLGFSGGMLAGVIQNQKDILKRLERLEKKLKNQKTQLESGDERYLGYLKGHALSSVNPKTVKRILDTALVTSPLLWLLTTIGLPHLPIPGNILEVLEPLSFASFPIATMGLISLTPQEKPVFSLTPADALRRLKSGKPIYVDGVKINSLAELSVLMKS